MYCYEGDENYNFRYKGTPISNKGYLIYVMIGKEFNTLKNFHQNSDGEASKIAKIQGDCTTWCALHVRVVLSY